MSEVEIVTEDTTSLRTWRNNAVTAASEAFEALLSEEFATDSADDDGVAHASAARATASTKLRRRTASPCPAWKRTIDVVGATALLVGLFPVFVCIGFFIRCVSRGPIFYRQERFGLNGRSFRVWKFRTIEITHDGGDHHEHVTDLMASDRPLEKRDHKLDIIRGGSFLRAYGIDELPQLINVLVGEMSLVGPRPDVVPYHHYERWHRRRFEVLPGITGLWQVRGKNRTTFSQMMQLDLAYVRRRSVWLDFSILFWTIPALFCD